jgi:hypothetical protein
VTSFTVILRPLDYGTATRGNPGLRETSGAGDMSESVGTSGPEKDWFIRVDAKEERGRS